MALLVFSDGFVEALADIKSDRLRERIVALVANLEDFPRADSPDVRASIKARFGGKVRKIVAGPYDIFYIYDEESDEAHIDALIHQRLVG